MKTILAIDLGKRNSVFCELNTCSLKSKYFTTKTEPQKFHDIFAELDIASSIVLFEVGTQAQAGWLSDMLRALRIEFKVSGTFFGLSLGFIVGYSPIFTLESGNTLLIPSLINSRNFTFIFNRQYFS